MSDSPLPNGPARSAQAAVEADATEGAAAEAAATADPAAPMRGWGEGTGSPLRMMGMAKGQRLVRKSAERGPQLTPEQRLLILDTWKRSGLGAGEFAAMMGMSKHTLYIWKRRFDEHGPAGLMDAKRGIGRGSHLPELTRRTILMLKQSNPEYGCQRISDMLLRGPALPASPSAVARVLHEAGYQLEHVPTQPHKPHVTRFERAKPNEMWQTDLFTFMLRRQNRRLYVVAFMDDHSRFLVSFGLWASPSTVLVIETLRAGIAAYGQPAEVLTDNGPQYVTWRGKSAFSRECEKRGIKQTVAAPKHPRTLGKVERFWGTLWRECLQTAVFIDVEDARRRIALFIDYYNFQRVHQGLDGLVPADRFFGAAPEVLASLKQRVAANAAEMAKNGLPKKPLYLTGQVDGKPVSLHAEGERVVLVGPEGRRELGAAESAAGQVAPLPEPVCPQGQVVSEGFEPGSEEPSEPGTSPLDALTTEERHE